MLVYITPTEIMTFVLIGGGRYGTLAAHEQFQVNAASTKAKLSL